MINRPQFDRLWDDSTLDERVEFRILIATANKNAVREWIRSHPSIDLMEKKLCDLQKIAYKLGIKNYSRQGKLELVQSIKEREEKYGSHQGIPA